MSDDQIVAAYSIATMKDGTKAYEVMRRAEINKVRQASQTGATYDRNGQPREPKGPWVDWFGEMAKKTVMRRHAKTLPMSGDILLDIEGRDLEMRGTAAALGVTPDAPRIEPPAEDPPHDAETGEIHEDTRAEGNAPANEDTDQSSDAAASTENGETTSSNGQTATTDASPSEDEGEREPTPSEEATDRVIADLEKAKTPAAVEKIIKEAEGHKAFMPDDLAIKLEVAFDKARKRVEAKEPAE